MSEATPEATGETSATETEEPQPQPETKATETVEFWKKKSREQEARAKANAEAARKLKELEDGNKTESDRLNERATQAEKRAADAERKALRLEVAAAKGLTPGQAKRLVGGSVEELEADADELLESFKQETRPNPSRKPREVLRGGVDPDQEPEETDPSKLADLIRTAREG